MKIKSVELEGKTLQSYNNIFIITFEPNWFERAVLKKTETQKKYKDNGDYYMFGSGLVYVDQLGNELGNGNPIGKAIDAWRRRW